MFSATTLLAIGIVMVFSSSSVRALQDYGDMYYFLKKQLIWAALGVLAMGVVSGIDYWHYRRLIAPAFVVNMILLVLVLIPGIGKVSHGARRWIGVGQLVFNPAELMKLTWVTFMSVYLTRDKDKIKRFLMGLCPYLVATGAIFGLILKEPDLGTALSIAGTTFVVLFAAGARLAHLFGLAVAAVPAFLWAALAEEYRRRRLFAFLDPWSDPSDSGYHIIQALYALGSGGLFGMGLGAGRQKMLYLPEAHTDFIFAILGEELGFIGAATVLALFFLFAWRGYRVAMTAPDTMSCLLATGVTTIVTLQAVINIGVVTASMPITGIPLPFISFGGSSLVPTMAGVGVLLNISRYCQE
ncbi:MAG: putative lipid II flippase FtsW [Firmicutes bacterium]|nr:putative lipid II flippase FtsW [Bacillota bacterium]